jgi:hypothetical protein
MKKRTSSLVLVLVAAVALVLGSLGTATAAGLTAHQVKKIAAKVVKKKAPGLSVAHATTADTATNATLLNGQPASAYQTTSWRYRLPTQAAATERIYSFPGLPVGTYSFTYSFVASGGGVGGFCYLRPTAANTGGEGFAYWTVPGTGFVTSSGGGIIQTTAAVNMRCAGTAFVAYNGADVAASVTFTKVDTLTNGTSTAPRGSDGVPAGNGPTN